MSSTRPGGGSSAPGRRRSPRCPWQETHVGPTHLRLHDQLLPRVPGSAMKGTGRLPGPAFPRPLATPRTDAPRSGSHQARATPATFEFQRLLPHSPRSALRGQSSPPPQSRANRSALCLPRPHPSGRRLLLPAGQAGWSHFRPQLSKPRCSGCGRARLRPAASDGACTRVTAIGGGTLEDRNHACAL